MASEALLPPMAEPRPPKRQKIDVACDTCRARKVKCDGVRPVCGVCLKRKDRGVGCKWSEEPRHRPNQNTSLPETRMPPVKEPRLTEGVSPLAFQNTATTQRQSQGPSPDFHHVYSNGYRTDVLPITPQESVQQTGDTVAGVDSMTGAIGAGEHGFFGSSSASSFLAQIKAAVDFKIMPASRGLEEGNRHRATLFPISPAETTRSHRLDSVEYVLPPRRIADSLIVIYWELVHPLYPFLDRHSFEQDYRCVWSGTQMRGDERIYMCTLNIIFALTCQLSETIKAEERAASAAVYFKRAQGLLQMTLWELGSGELIQCLLLMSQYLQSTNTPHQCWMAVGHAVRVAQGLGFHLPESYLALESQRERELARRIWHGCILMDRVLSMTLGRPVIVSKALANVVPLPALIDDDFLSNESGISHTQPEGSPSVMHFFVKSLQLHNIINDILSLLYAGEENITSKDPANQSQFGNLATVLQLDRDLMKWGQTLPKCLRISSFELYSNHTFLRQAIIIRIRFLHTRILLFRPIFARFCLPQRTPADSGTFLDESLTQRMVLQCSSLCLRAAHDLIDIVYVNLNKEGKTGLLPAWWYNIFYIYTAATCLLAARVRPEIQADIAEYTVTTSWEQAISILKSLECFGESAQRCVAALEILSAKVSSMAFNGDQQQQSEGETQELQAQTASKSMQVGQGSNTEGRMDLGGINIDMNDMSWLSSMPGTF